MRLRIVFIGGLFLILLLLGGREWLRRSPTQIVDVRFFDVGQGDSALLSLPGNHRILIDGGPDWSTLERLGETMPFFDRSIDLAVLSHPNSDHAMSFIELLKRYEIGAVLAPPMDRKSPIATAMTAEAQRRSIPLKVAYHGDRVQIGDATVNILWPPRVTVDPTKLKSLDNTLSLIVGIDAGGKRLLFTGDANADTERGLLAGNADIRCDVLKVAHHGSKTATSTAFLGATQPTLAIISVGKDNAYGHPHPDVLQRIAAEGIPIRRTDIEGTIRLSWTASKDER